MAQTLGWVFSLKFSRGDDGISSPLISVHPNSHIMLLPAERGGINSFKMRFYENTDVLDKQAM
jgi:hypothetical protein